MTLAVDISNYTDPITPAAAQALKGAGVELVLVQAVDPPPGYPAGVTRSQIQTCLDAGLAVDAYVWLWFDLDVADIQHKLALLDGLSVRQLWLDVEDTAAIKYDQATCEQKVSDALAACDAYTTTSGQKTGVYSGRWFWADRRYMGNTTAFSDRELWDAQYDLVADTGTFVPYGGWTNAAIKQYQGTTSLAGVGGLDLNVLSVGEAAELGTGPAEPADPCAAVANDRNGLVSSLGLIAGDRLKPVALQKASSVAVRNLVNTIRAEADAHGIAHA
jgi:hypothetical protein